MLSARGVRELPARAQDSADDGERGSPSQRARWAAARLLVAAGEAHARGEALPEAEASLRAADVQAARAWGADDWLAFSVRAKLASFLR